MQRSHQERFTAEVSLLSNNCLLQLGLQHILEQEGWIHLNGYAANGTALDDLLKRECLDIMILDSEIAQDVTPLIQKIRTVDLGIRIILLCGLREESANRAIDLRVDGIVLKTQPSGVLIATIDHLTQSAEETWPRGVNRVTGLNAFRSLNNLVPSPGHPPESKRPDGLTERECQIIRCVTQGLSNKDIAERLCISSITVRHHLTNIFDKLGVSNRQKLLIHAHQCGIADAAKSYSTIP